MVVGDRQLIACGCARRITHRGSRATRPVEPSGPVVRPREAGGCRLEEPDRFSHVALAIRRPSGLPRRALRVASARESLVHLAKHVIRLVIAVALNEEGREVVHRLFCPRAVGKIPFERVHELLERVVIAQPAVGHQVEETRLGLPGAACQERPQRVFRVAVARLEIRRSPRAGATRPRRRSRSRRMA